jgi:hypothetical protein
MGTPNPIVRYEGMAAAASNILDKAADLAKSRAVHCELVHVQG